MCQAVAKFKFKNEGAYSNLHSANSARVNLKQNEPYRHLSWAWFFSCRLIPIFPIWGSLLTKSHSKLSGS